MGHIWRETSLDEIRGHLIAAKEELGRERLDIFAADPLPKKIERAQYGFAYLQTERLGVAAIHQRLAEVAWLPGKIDTSTEVTADVRERLSRWISDGDGITPGAEIFGNEFIHALTRCMLRHGTNSPHFQAMAERIACLFRDLAYLVCSIHCCSIFKDLGVDSVPLSNPHNLGQSALEMTGMLNALSDRPSPTANPEVNENSKAAHLKLVHDAEALLPES